MMKHVSILILIFLACLFAGCADEPIDSPEGLPEKGIVVKLTTGQLDTKTHLYSQATSFTFPAWFENRSLPVRGALK